MRSQSACVNFITIRVSVENTDGERGRDTPVRRNVINRESLLLGSCLVLEEEALSGSLIRPPPTTRCQHRCSLSHSIVSAEAYSLFAKQHRGTEALKMMLIVLLLCQIIMREKEKLNGKHISIECSSHVERRPDEWTLSVGFARESRLEFRA
jgi:hypothetical protein